MTFDVIFNFPTSKLLSQSRFTVDTIYIFLSYSIGILRSTLLTWWETLGWDLTHFSMLNFDLLWRLINLLMTFFQWKSMKSNEIQHLIEKLSWKDLGYRNKQFSDLKSKSKRSDWSSDFLQLKKVQTRNVHFITLWFHVL